MVCQTWAKMTGFYCPLNTPLYVYYREIKILQTLHKPLHSIHISLILRALRCVGFEAKILHKPYMEPYMGTKSQRVKETKRLRDKERKSGREEGKEKLGEGKEKLEEGKEKFEEGK